MTYFIEKNNTAKASDTRTGSAQLLLYVLTAAVVALVIGIGYHGIDLGLSENTNSEAIYNTFGEILRFHYIPSRSWGVPLYEITGALLNTIGGMTLVNTASLLFTLVFVACVIFIVRPDRDLRGLLALAAAVLNPLVLSNASSLFETSMYVMLAFLSLVCALWYIEYQRHRALLGVFLFMGLMVFARPDSAVFAIALAISLVLEQRKDRRTAFALICGTILTGAVVLLLYVWLNHGLGFLGADVLQGRGQRLQRAAISLIDLYGLAGSATIVTLIFLMPVRSFRKWLLVNRDRTSFLDRLAVITIIFYVPRYLMLPDVLEYFMIPFILSIILFERQIRPLLPLAVICLSIILNSVFHISLLSRVDGRLVFSPALNEGAVQQDWRVRSFNLIRHNIDFRRFVAKSVYGPATPLPQVQAPTYGVGFVSEQGDLILGKSLFYLIDSPATSYAVRYRSETYNRIYVCDEDLWPTAGWRRMQAEPSYTAINEFRVGKSLSCQLMKK